MLLGYDFIFLHSSEMKERLEHKFWKTFVILYDALKSALLLTENISSRSLFPSLLIFP